MERLPGEVPGGVLDSRLGEVLANNLHQQVASADVPEDASR